MLIQYFHDWHENINARQMDDIRSILLALICGLIVGLIFSGLKLDVPGPTTLVSISGIIGLYLGMIVVRQMRHV